LAVAASSGCSDGDATIERFPSRSFSNPEETPLGRLVTGAGGAEAEHSGVIQLGSGREALETRITLADAAARSIDVQYYIWRSDKTGRQLTQSLQVAADRGVRIRVLLDDYGVDQEDNAVVSLDAHANVEVRAYNPVSRTLRAALSGKLGFRELLAQLNRRMHSKTFIVDESLAVAGGRNIGDEYFDASQDMNFVDRELLVAGPVVIAMSDQFDVMWNSEWSIPVSVTSSMAKAGGNRSSGVGGAAADSLGRVRDWILDMVWAPVEFAYNPPEMTGGNENPEKSVAKALRGLVSEARRELLIESSYFIVPDDELENLGRLLERGLKIAVLTNSLASTDVWTIHSGYTRNRPEVIRRGVRLHEFRSDAISCPSLIINPKLNCDEFKFSLHSKAVVFDRKIVYIGSFNLNPRSELVNTETALIVHSPELARQVADNMRFNMHPDNSWGVTVTSAGALEWRGNSNDQVLIHAHEPDAGVLLRIASWAYSAIAIDKYL